ncbi:MAG TPA: hypothetical protein VN900_10030 [Stellaceae bacterium]|nr:hypothetical protein [Stellaceae bacterium]
MPTATLSIDAPVCVSAVSKFVANPLSPRLPPLVSGATVVDALRTPATVANSPSTTPPVRTIAKSRVSSKICAGLIDALAIGLFSESAAVGCGCVVPPFARSATKA